MTTERDLINQLAYREKKGRTEGIEIGKTRGVEETKLATAKKMLSKNYPINEISDITGLSEEEIGGIKSNTT